MKLIRSFVIAIMTYSIIPMPNVKWEPDNTKYAIAFFPFIGTVIGGVLYLWHCVCDYVGLGNMIFAAGAIAIPILITGGIHIDGYMDTIDALASNTEKERMLEILKDSRVGAFAVIYEVLYMIVCFAIFSSAGLMNIATLCISYTLSRGLSGLLASILPNARKSGMLDSMIGAKEKRTTVGICIWLVLIVCICSGLIWYFGNMVMLLSMLLGAGTAVIYYCFRVVKKLRGVTGDTSGYFLQLCELYMLIGFYIGTLIA